jgi:hypothetical protein
MRSRVSRLQCGAFGTCGALGISLNDAASSRGLADSGPTAMHLFRDLFAGAPHVGQVLGLLQLAFTVWMVVDAYQRRVEPFWYWVILIFQPIGAWVYFFAVKARTLRLPKMGRATPGERRLSLDELRYRVERTPTLANRLALAQRLSDKGAPAEAVPHLEAVLAVEPDYCAALHALAECRLATGAAEQAVAPLERLVRRDPRWEDHRAWRTLIEVHQARGQPADALAACRELAKRLPTLENTCLLAEHLLDTGRPAEAVPLLDEALADHRYAPWGARWRDRRWSRAARRLLAEAEKGKDVSENPEAK